MDLNALQHQALVLLRQTGDVLQKVPGSAVVARYVQSSYQNDPVRSAIELVLLLFFLRYILSPSYSTRKENFIKLRDDVCACTHAHMMRLPPEPLLTRLTLSPRKLTSSSTSGRLSRSWRH
jgi:serine palmitoyltransferase